MEEQHTWCLVLEGQGAVIVESEHLEMETKGEGPSTGSKIEQPSRSPGLAKCCLAFADNLQLTLKALGTEMEGGPQAMQAKISLGWSSRKTKST